jgi:hypothetical protein
MRELFKAVLKIDKDSGESVVLKNGNVDSIIFDNYKNVYSVEAITDNIDIAIFKVSTKSLHIFKYCLFTFLGLCGSAIVGKIFNGRGRNFFQIGA